MPNVDLSFAFGLPPEKAVEYFRAKGYTIGWDWRETLHEAHAKAFTVAKVMKVDVLEDIRGAVDRALHDGLTLADFKKDLIPTLQKKGWWGEITHPETGEPAFIDARRLTTIYQTNLQTAYMTGRYQAMMENSSKRPYWMYVSILDGRTRPAHKAMNGRIFRFDDPIWNTIYPPNGFRCRCRVQALSESDLAGRSVLSSAGRLDSIEVAMGKDDTFTTVSRYKGVDGKGKAFTFSPDPGWSYNPGKAALKPFTPPPLDNLPQTFKLGMKLPSLPKAEQLSTSLRLPKGLSETQYYQHFLDQFPADTAVTGVFKDVAGDAVPISADLFKDSYGASKILKNGRETEIAYLAQTIINPDEIWLSWQKVKSTGYALRRRYIKQIVLDEVENISGVGVYEMGKDGWSGITVFDPRLDVIARYGFTSVEEYLNAQRGGMLRYIRPDKT
jgi:SPP1 gp7 family putative phage head morphogenesis protein